MPLCTSHTLKPQQTLFFVFNHKHFKTSKRLVYYITYTTAFSDSSFTPGFSCFPPVSCIFFVWKASFSECFRAGLLPAHLVCPSSEVILLSPFFLKDTVAVCGIASIEICAHLNLWSTTRTAFCGCSRGFFRVVLSSLILTCLEYEFGVRCRLSCLKFPEVLEPVGVHVLPGLVSFCHSFFKCFRALSRLSGLPVIQIVLMSPVPDFVLGFRCLFSVVQTRQFCRTVCEFSDCLCYPCSATERIQWVFCFLFWSFQLWLSFTFPWCFSFLADNFHLSTQEALL